MLIPQENPKGIHLYSLELKHNFYKKYFAHFLLRKHILSSKRTPHSSLTQSQEVSSKGRQTSIVREVVQSHLVHFITDQNTRNCKVSQSYIIGHHLLLVIYSEK